MLFLEIKNLEQWRSAVLAVQCRTHKDFIFDGKFM
jgi:hypothetical protein